MYCVRRDTDLENALSSSLVAAWNQEMMTQIQVDRDIRLFLRNRPLHHHRWRRSVGLTLFTNVADSILQTNYY